MARLSPDTPFDLVHVGKCGGSSIVADLQARGFAFEHFHLRRPVWRPGRPVVVLVRDPVARFVSAFNWRFHLLATGRLPRPGEQDPIRLMRLGAEFAFLSHFADVNALAEQLELPEGNGLPPIFAMLRLIGHAEEGFAWHLADLLDRLAPEQLAGVIATERLASDCTTVFGSAPTAETNSGYPSRGTALSPRGRANLARQLRSEYATLARLAALARQAGTPMSVAYDPLAGAIIRD